MGSKSDYLEQKLLDHTLGNTPFSAPANVFMALFSVTPGDAVGGTEATGSGYARLSITNNTTNWPNATGTSPTTKNNGVVFTMEATGDWSSGVNQVAWGIFDASSGGNLLYWGALGQPKPVLNTDTVSFAVNAVVITED